MNLHRYSHHKYTWTMPFRSVRHQWELIGPKGGMHFHASEYKGEWSCGLETHYLERQGDRAPSQVSCWLLHAPCWHDGTSLYATEHVWPIIGAYIKRGEHEKIFEFLEHESDGRFGSGGTDMTEDENSEAA